MSSSRFALISSLYDMMRCVFNIFALLSLLLCVATVVLWVRSYWVWDVYAHVYDLSPSYWAIHSDRGAVTVFVPTSLTGSSADSMPDGGGLWSHEVVDGPVVSGDLGYRELGCFGSGDAKTPHLEQLRCRLTSFYASWPAYIPSRASLLTGRYPQRNGTCDMNCSEMVDFGHQHLPSAVSSFNLGM